MSLSVTRSKRKRSPGSRRRKSVSSGRAPVGERYTPARKAEFLLNNAATVAEYRVARKEVAALGLDPDSIPHTPPSSR
jgi:hypothetical protein